MTVKDLITGGGKRNLSVRTAEEHPFFSLQRQMNDIFSSFIRGFDVAPFRELGEWEAGFSPRVDVKETDRSIEIAAELPGIDEQDIDISLASDAVTIKGEKREEKEEKNKNCWHMERRYGAFHRVIPLAQEIDADKAEASFKKGVLHVTLPKLKKSEVGKKIAIKTEK
ncbi:MAG: Hsp20/alpha crystallin family protein [Deltaproteobacteria bacterium]|nr:Hsp20/alpha crystallin family protein [Deltaproteobacteria bacterium]